MNRGEDIHDYWYILLYIYCNDRFFKKSSFIRDSGYFSYFNIFVFFR